MTVKRCIDSDLELDFFLNFIGNLLMQKENLVPTSLLFTTFLETGINLPLSLQFFASFSLKTLMTLRQKKLN